MKTPKKGKIKIRLPKPKETLDKAGTIERRKHSKNTIKRLFAITSVLFTIAAVFWLSKYAIANELHVSMINQTSACLSSQPLGSSAAWRGNAIYMETAFEMPDPCYTIKSITAIKHGNKIEVGISLASGGICVQCFGYKQVQYELITADMVEIEDKMNIEINIEGAAQNRVTL